MPLEYIDENSWIPYTITLLPSSTLLPNVSDRKYSPLSKVWKSASKSSHQKFTIDFGTDSRDIRGKVLIIGNTNFATIQIWNSSNLLKLYDVDIERDPTDGLRKRWYVLPQNDDFEDTSVLRLNIIANTATDRSENFYSMGYLGLADPKELPEGPINQVDENPDPQYIGDGDYSYALGLPRINQTWEYQTEYTSADASKMRDFLGQGRSHLFCINQASIFPGLTKAQAESRIYFMKRGQSFSQQRENVLTRYQFDMRGVV